MTDTTIVQELLPPDLESLEERVNSGDTEAREMVLLSVYARLKGLTRPGQSDVVQGLALRLLRRLERGEIDLRRLYLGIAKIHRRGLIDRARRRKAYESATQSTTPKGLTDRLDPETRLELERAVRGLRKVNPRAADAFLLAHHGGLSRKEIMKVMSLEGPKVHRALQDAREFLRSQMASAERSKNT